MNLDQQERWRRASEMRDAGYSFRKIGKELGISGSRAQSLVTSYRLNNEDPLGRFSTRVSNALRWEREVTIEEIAQRSVESLLSLRNFGKKSLVECESVLSGLGFTEDNSILLADIRTRSSIDRIRAKLSDKEWRIVCGYFSTLKLKSSHSATLSPCRNSKRSD